MAIPLRQLPRALKIFASSPLKISAGVAYYLYRKRAQPEAFDTVVSEGISAQQCVQFFRYEKGIVDWFCDYGEDTLRYDYPLTADSVVLDVGGFVGDWAERISERYGSRLFVFEPVPATAKRLRDRLAQRDRVRVFPYGLSAETETVHMTGEHIGASVSAEGPVTAQLRDIYDVMMELELDEVDLCKINIEGSEYGLLTRVVDAGLISRFARLQIQFHRWVPNADQRYAAIARALKRTHELTWRYPWVWENWERRPSVSPLS